MRKVSILALHLGFGGIEKCIVSLANMLCDNYNVEIAVCYRLYDESAFELDDRVKVKYLNKKNIIPNHEKIRKALKSKNIFSLIKEGLFAFKVLYYRRKNMIKYIKNKKCDIIISTRDIFNYWVSDYAKDDTLKIGWEHNHFHDNLKYATNIVNSSKRLDYLVLVSSELKDYYEKELIKYDCRCVHIPNSIDKLPSKTSKLDNKKLVSVGRLSPEKGYLDLLKVYNQLSKSHPDWTLDIIGDGQDKSLLQDYIVKHNLEDKVTLHGFQRKDYIDKILNQSSIYLMTSFTESFGIVLIEAMSHGVPCIAFDSAEGAKEIINSGENGYLIKNRSFDAMVMMINYLIEKEDERKSIGAAAFKSVKRYTSENVRKEWITLIEKGDEDE